MAFKSDIQWTEATWNPWHGCIKVSPGCRGCYMYRTKSRWGADPSIVQRSKTRFNDPLKWKEPRTIFTCSWSDWFIEQADEWRAEAWAIVKATPRHTYQILTKRPERIIQCLPDDWDPGLYDNVWIGVSGESEKWTYSRLTALVSLKRHIGPRLFLSAEPLLEPIHTQRIADLIKEIDWVIIGGESGNATGKWTARPLQLAWIDNLIRICRERNVAVFVKQLGSYQARHLKLNDSHGGNMEEWPKMLRVREMPT